MGSNTHKENGYGGNLDSSITHTKCKFYIVQEMCAKPKVYVYHLFEEIELLYYTHWRWSFVL